MQRVENDGITAPNDEADFDIFVTGCLGLDLRSYARSEVSFAPVEDGQTSRITDDRIRIDMIDLAAPTKERQTDRKPEKVAARGLRLDHDLQGIRCERLTPDETDA